LPPARLAKNHEQIKASIYGKQGGKKQLFVICLMFASWGAG